jgi:hypothetical protein
MISAATALIVAATATGCAVNQQANRLGEPGDTFVLTASDRLLSINKSAPSDIKTDIKITGLGSGESLIGIDIRPKDGKLYTVSTVGKVYTINVNTGEATYVSTLAADTVNDGTDKSSPTKSNALFSKLEGTKFDLDFNPVADRLRIVSDARQNLRINVDTGATITDGEITKDNSTTGFQITGAAYTNSFTSAAVTRLFDIDTQTKTLVTQDANNGPIRTQASLGVDATTAIGFDIDAKNNDGYAVLEVGGKKNLYKINLSATENAASLISEIAVKENIKSLALKQSGNPSVVALTVGQKLVSFNPTTPNQLSTPVPIVGLAQGETVVSIDYRPRDGKLYGLSSAGKLYTIDDSSGAVSLQSTLTEAQTIATGITAGEKFAIDFNPVANALRVLGSKGTNLRVPDTSSGRTVVDKPLAQGYSPVSAAYQNNFDGTKSTELINIDAAGKQLVLQSPPNEGAVAPVGQVGNDLINFAGLEFVGGDNGVLLLAARPSLGGAYGLFRVDRKTGVASKVPTATGDNLIGGLVGPELLDIAVRY